MAFRTALALGFASRALAVTVAVAAPSSDGGPRVPPREGEKVVRHGTSESPGASPPLPPARSVDALLTDIVKALGGAENLNRHRSVRTRVQITFKGLGMTGSAEHLAAAGGRALTVTSIPGLASTREGCDGHQCWSEDPINGLRVLTGAEAEQAVLETAWNPELHFKELFTRLEVRNERDESGAVLECLILTPKGGAPWTNCFDGVSHLLALQRVTHAGPQGDVPFTSRFSDWRMVEGIAMPYATEMQAGPLSFVGTVTSIEIDPPVSPRMFAAPKVPGVKADPKGKSPAQTRPAPPPAKPKG